MKAKRPGRPFAVLAATVLLVFGGAPPLASARGASTHKGSPQLASAPRVGSLTTEHLDDPLGIDSRHPLLGWVITSSGRGVSQAGYQVRVAPVLKNLLRGRQLVWNTRRSRGSRSFDVPYAGRALRPRTRYFWQVRVWDNHARISAWSRPTWFETAFLDPGEFHASWIGQYPDAQQQNASAGELLFRKQFMLPACRRTRRSRARCVITRARLYIVGLSYPYVSIDGRRVSNHVLDTAFTTFNKTVDYTTYDVTRLLRAGKVNAVGVSLGHGFYAGGADDYPSSGETWQPARPKFKLELDVWSTGRRLTRVLSDASWRVSTGPTTTESPAQENYDARLEKPGWTRAGYAGSAWAPVATVSPPAGVLRAQLIPPVLKTETIKPLAVASPQPTAKVYDFGITTSGWARITLQGAAGTTVYVEYSEQLNSDGTVQTEGQAATGQTDVYILKGGGRETYEPRYGWKGYRYVEVTTTSPPASSTVPGASNPPSSVPLPQIDSLSGIVVHTALANAGGFASSNALLNRMHLAMRNTILNNQYSYGSDSPTYEKGGWTGDLGYYSTSEIANFDAEAYYDHTMQNFDDSQYPNGNIGWRVPTPNTSIDSGVDPLWGGQFLLIEYGMFQAYDDLDVIRRDYSHMAAYMDLLAGQIASSGEIYMGTTFGDWVVPPNGVPPSSQLIGSMFISQQAKDLARMAAAIGKSTDATKYSQLAASIATAINNKFYDAVKHQYGDPPGTTSQAVGEPFGVTPVCNSVPPAVATTRVCSGYDQTANAIALAFEIAPVQDRASIAAGLAADAVAKGDHLGTGAAGSKYLLPSLTEGDNGLEALKIAVNPTAPGWGQLFMQCGATTMYESWEDSTCASARSHDHAFLGTIDDWMFADLAGIQASAPGFASIQIKPFPISGLMSASGYVTSPFGRVSSSWTRNGRDLRLTVRVPVGTHAIVFVPTVDASSVTESGRPLRRASGVMTLSDQSGYLELRVGSGTYAFRSTLAG